MPHLFDALADLSELTLGCSSSLSEVARDSHFGRREASARQLMGGLVYMWSDAMALHVGVLASPRDCTLLAGRLLGKPDELGLSHLVVRGAMCELAYLLAGGVKRRLLRADSLSVGQPCFLEGMIKPRLGWEVQSTGVEIGGVAATLVCMTRSGATLLL